MFQQVYLDNNIFISKDCESLATSLAYVDYRFLFECTVMMLNTAIADLLMHFDGSFEPSEWYIKVYFDINTGFA